MTEPLLVFASTFVAVFALGFQSLNVNQGRYVWAAITSLAIGLSTILLYRTMPGANAPEALAYLAGGVTGITSSMYFHRRLIAWCREQLERWIVRTPKVDAPELPAFVCLDPPAGARCASQCRFCIDTLERAEQDRRERAKPRDEHELRIGDLPQPPLGGLEELARELRRGGQELGQAVRRAREKLR